MMSESLPNPFGSGGNLTLETSNASRHTSNNSTADSPILSPMPNDSNNVYGQTTVNDVPLITGSGGQQRLSGLGTAMCSKTQYDINDVHNKLDTFKQWGMSTYKCTKQAIYEHLGKTNRTVDAELEQKIEQLRDLQRRYGNLLALAKGFTSYFQNMTQLQKQMAESFADMAQKEPQLQDEFTYNSDTQRTIVRQSDTLLSALNFYIGSLQTLCEKTIEDTLTTIRLFDTARLEYDAYRADLATLQQSSGTSGGMDLQAKLHTAEQRCQEHKEKYEQLRDDVQVKLKFLDENRVKVMQKQLLLLHNALAAYFSGNSSALEASLHQFSIKPQPQANNMSFLEDN